MFRGYFYIFKLPFINYTIQYFTYKFWDKRVQEIEKEKGGKNGKIRFVTKISVLCETQVRVLWHDYSTHRVQ